MSEVAACFLGHAIDGVVEYGLPIPVQRSTRRWRRVGPVDGKVIKIRGHALLPEGDRMIKEVGIIVVYRDADHALDHAQLPIAVIAGAVDQVGQHGIVHHGAEGLGIGRRPARIAIADNLSRPRPL